MSQLVRLEGKHTTQNAHCALVPCVNLWHFRRRQRACWTRGTTTGGRLQSYLFGDNLRALSNLRHSDGRSARVLFGDNLLPHQCQLRTFKNTCGNYIVDFGSYSLWSNCGRMLSILAPILGTTSCQGHTQHNVNWGLPQFSWFLCSVALCQGGRLTSCSIWGESTPAWEHMYVLITCDEICNLDALQMVSSVDTVAKT